MAYDKAVDSSALNTNLTAVANAIRSKGGTSASLAFPSGFVDAISKIETGGKVTTEVHDITIASTLGNGTNSEPKILTGNAFVKANYAKDTFAALLYAKAPVATNTMLHHSIYHGNANLGSSNYPRYGFSYAGNSATSLGMLAATTKISATGWNVSLRAASNGNLGLYVANNRSVPAGDYVLVLMCWEGL